MGVHTNTLGSLAERNRKIPDHSTQVDQGLGGWLVNRLRHRTAAVHKLKILEQIRVTPRQLLVLVEVEGERLLLATSDASAPVFYPVKRLASGSRKRNAEIRIEGTCA